MIYFDTSALMKLVVREAETLALTAWLAQNDDDPHVTSALGRIELMRAAARDGRTATVERARDLLDGMQLVAVSDDVVRLAESIGPPSLRSLEAIHLASAAQIPLTAFVAYDQRLLEGARALGYPTHQPSR